jgi:ligand-binding sensor domain-containing protein/two-component sensor histidine kinase
MKVIQYVLFLIGFSFSAGAQISELEPLYRNFDVEQGLPSSETYFVHQDREGYMWFCTDRGVVRYDGFRMVVFDQSNGLLDNVVFSIYEDRKGRLWFITMNGKLTYYFKGKIYPYKYNELLLQSMNLTYPIKALTIDKDDNLYYSVQGINSVKVTAKGKLTVFKHDSVSRLKKVVDKWFYIYPINGVSANSFCYSNPKHLSEIETYHSSTIKNVISVVEINSKMIIRANPIVYEAFNKKNHCDYLNVTGLFTTKNKVWICSTKGAYMFDVDSNFDLSKPDCVFLKDVQVSCVTIDREGGYWFSTLDNGVYYAPNVAIQNLKLSKVRSENNIYDINSAKGELFYSNILGFHHFKTGEQVNPPVQFSSQNRMFEWNGKLFVGPGTYKVKEKYSKCFLINEGAYAGIVKDKLGGFYYSYSNLNYHTPSGKTEKIYSFPMNGDKGKHQQGIIHALAFDDKGNLYGGSINGLYLFVNGDYKQVKLPADLMDVRVTDMKYHPKWGLVVATRGKGIYILKNGKVIKRITAQNGLVNDLLNSLYFDESGKLFATSNRGFSKIERFSNSFFRIQNLSKLNGLESSEVNMVYKLKGKLYVATKLGIGVIDENYKWPIEYPKKQLQIESIFVNGKELSSINKGFEFDHTKKVIRFLLKNTNFKSQTKQPYRYRFSKDDPWITGTSGEILLLNPSFEHFFLEVSYKNEYGLWSKPYVLSDFTIYPPFYATNWFFATILILIVASGFLFFKRRLTVIQRKNELLRKVDNLEQKALLAQMNPHFIFNSLNSIQSFLLFNENELAERYLIKLSQLIRMTLTNSRESEITVQQEIDVLTKYLELEKMRFKDRFEFEIDIALSKEELNLFVPPMLIQPFIENSIIHGFKQLNQGGLIQLSFKSIQEGKLVVEVMDNGLGYLTNKNHQKDSTHKSYGTQITSERLSLFKEKYDSEFDFSIQAIQDSEQQVKGTKVTISIPIFSKV